MERYSRMDKKDIYYYPPENYGYYWNRTICEVFEEMRQCNKTRNYAPLTALIEEAQTFANRMEAKLHDVKEYRRTKEEYKRMREAITKKEEETNDT